MRTPLDLIELPYSFSQLGLMLADEFCREARERGVHLSAEELEALHRAQLLVPFYREAASPRALRAARRSRQWAFQLGHWSVPSRADLVEALSEDRLRDPDASRFARAASAGGATHTIEQLRDEPPREFWRP